MAKAVALSAADLVPGKPRTQSVMRQRGVVPSAELVPLQFRMPPEFVRAFKQAALDGKVFAKTGTLGEARALSGYLVARSGQTVAFSIMCTDHSPSLPADRIAMDKIVAAIADAN